MSVDFQIKQGETWLQVVRWYSTAVAFLAVSAISRAAPAEVTTGSAHGLPDGWKVAVEGVKGMHEINAETDDAGTPLATEYHAITGTGASTLTLDGVNSLGFSTYASGGALRYNPPVELTGYTARMHIRDSVDATTTLLELTTENGGIAIDTANKKITLTITAAQAEAITWESAVYDLELVATGGAVTRLLEGAITVSKEVTR